MFYMLYDFQDDANARPVYNRDKNDDRDYIRLTVTTKHARY